MQSQGAFDGENITTKIQIFHFLGSTCLRNLLKHWPRVADPLFEVKSLQIVDKMNGFILRFDRLETIVNVKVTCDCAFKLMKFMMRIRLVYPLSRKSEMYTEYLEYSSGSLTSFDHNNFKRCSASGLVVGRLVDEVSRMWQSHNGRPRVVLFLRKRKEPSRLGATTY